VTSPHRSDSVNLFTRFMYSLHIRLKFGEIRSINQRFITEKPTHVGHFSLKFRGALAQKLKVESETVAYGKNVTVILYPRAMIGGDRFTHGDARMKITGLLCFVFVTRGVVYFGLADLPRCSAL